MKAWNDLQFPAAADGEIQSAELAAAADACQRYGETFRPCEVTGSSVMQSTIRLN